jgi:N-acylneuraminate cytidylyltransferase
MGDSMQKNKVIGFVPIRSGSKSIKDKNIKIFYGKPLIYWVLEALQKSKKINKVVVAADSGKYKKIISEFDFSKVEIYDRLPENATDTATTESVMLEYINYAKLNHDDIFILVQATSPFTTKHDFDNAITEHLNSGKDSMLSCVKTKRFFWNSDGTPLNYDYKNRPRRQDFDGLFMENGAFYINSVANILQYQNRLSGQIGIYEMPE